MSKTNIPNDQIMREMAKLAVKNVTEMFARQAEYFANGLPAGVDGKAAMLAFARAIRSTNSKIFSASES